MSKKIRLAVLFGGIGSEHEVSCISAAAILRNLDPDKYDVYKVGITKDGRWFHTDAPVSVIESDKWQEHSSNRRALITPDRGFRGLVYMDDELTCATIDCVYLALHGNYAEDGTVQGLLDLAGIPYTGSGVNASASGMDKSLTKMVVQSIGVKQADFYLVRDWMAREGAEALMDDVESHFDGRYPLFVKPASEGSSVGISKVHDRSELEAGLDLALGYDNKVLVEEAIVGREMEVAVLGNERPRATVPGEILAANEFYDYSAKYLDNRSETRIADDLTEEKIEEFRESAVKIYKALDCRGLARVDFFMEEDGTLVFNEVNTLPGFTSISMYPQLWEAEGLPIGSLLDELIGYAME